VERTAEGRWVPYVLDFGVAHDSNAGHSLTQTGALLGTPQYMSPEQARSDTKNIDRRSDVYSLGAMLYELLTGVPPVQAENLTDILLQVLDNEPTPPRQLVPDLPVALETVTLKCLQKEPAARYDSAKALAEDLRRYLDDVPVQARRVSLVRKLLKKARRNKPLVAVGIALVLSLLGLATYGVKNRLDARAREQRAIQQAALAQKLGQEIKDMEWLLRSSRQLQLHDLEREKVIVRKRMSKLSQELQGYGELSSGLAHYALGRGHMALHEYPQALAELQKAIAKGYQDGEVYYALGFVLGKHYEQAMADARLSGGGDWAKKQLKEIEPKYLTPAIAALQRSRNMKVDSPHYLDGLIAFYQRDYDGALKHADMALKEAPWLYEASKLAGDVHHERALQARDSGKDDDAKREFAAAVKSFEAAAAEGHSDAEVYEGLAEAWVRQIEMAVVKELPTDEAYAAAVAASDKITVAEPGSVSGPLKKAYAAMFTLAVTTFGPSSTERVQRCVSASQEVLVRQPGNPYASDAASNCYLIASELARQHGNDPIPLLRNSLQLLEPVIQQYPHFLWGVNDLGSIFLSLGIQQQLIGDNKAQESINKSLRYFKENSVLDHSYISSSVNSMIAKSWLILLSKSKEELQQNLSDADRFFSECTLISHQDLRCYNSYFPIYSRAAYRIFMQGGNPQPSVQRALQHLALARQLGGKLLDVAQHAALTYLVQARELLREKLSPAASLTLLEASLMDCFALAPEDVMCRTLAAQALWVRADWQAAQHLPFAETLTAAMAKARVAAESPEISPDAWQTLAETQLRIAQSTQAGKARTLHINDGLAALQKLFSINPNHALGLITQGQLLLLRAQGEQVAAQRYQSIKDAAAALERAFTNDPFVRPTFLPILESAKALLSKP
jgi:tetratricopeptide (TPR) repeat protein